MTNPFEEEKGFEITVSGGAIEEDALTGSDRSFPPSEEKEPSAHMSLDQVAKRLLQENFVLTALEFHTELMESGRDLRRLRDFFSNPVHFEAQAISSVLEAAQLRRTSSVQTIDSMDFTRYSDEADKDGNDRLAVLEFELRKSKETIKTLREQLTQASEQIGVTSEGHEDAGETPDTETPSLLAHEQRALNFLVNEYLLLSDYKLTAVTLSDEVPDQDLEDWDDVGLNIPRAPNLATLYRIYGQVHGPRLLRTKDEGVAADLDRDCNPFSQEEMLGTDKLIERLNAENADLLQKNNALSDDFEKLQSEIKELQMELSAKPDLAAVVERERSPRSPSAHQPGKRTVPLPFVRALQHCLSHHSQSDDPRLLKQIDNVGSEAEQLVEVSAACLPRIIPGVLLNNRGELIPLILATVFLHPESPVRDLLLEALFNLIKKPDEDQRKLILSGCVAFAKRMGPTRTEAELLPHCWEQISHKHPERRLLVAEACGALAPLLPPALLSSLLLSMLQQMLLEDGAEEVREAAARNFSCLCLFIEDKDKYSQVSDLVQRAIADSCESVAQTACQLLVPAFGLWADEIGKLQLGVLSLLIRKLSQMVSTSGVRQSANETVLLTYVACLHSLTPLLFCSVLRSGPYASCVSFDLNCVTADLPSERYPAAWGHLDSIHLLMPDKEALAALTSAYDRHTAEEWYQTWDALDFVIKNMLPELVGFFNKLESNLPRVLSACVQYISNLAHYFGRNFSLLKMRPVFLASLAVPTDAEGRVSTDVSTHPVSFATLPIFCAGLLAAFETEEDVKDLKRFLRAEIGRFGSEKWTPVALLGTLEELSARQLYQRHLLDLVWEFVPHPQPGTRALCASLFSHLIPRLEQKLFRDRVLPGLITLASDVDRNVRVATIPGFGAALTVAASSEPDVLHKLRLQLRSFFEDSDAEVVIALIKNLAQTAPNLDSAFRDDFVVPQLLLSSMRNSSCGEPETQRALAAALFQVFSALSCCFLSPEALAESFVPGLRCLIKDLDLERSKVANSILREAESKLPSASSESRKPSLGPEVAVEEVRARMLTKFRDIRDKMDQHRDTVPNIFKKK